MLSGRARGSPPSYNSRVGLRLRLFLLVLLWLTSASGWAQSSCGFFERKIRFADGQQACAGDFPLLRREGLIANESSSFATRVRSSASYAIAFTADPRSCPFASYMAWDWAGQDAAEALQKCEVRLADAVRKSGAAGSGCRCQTVVDNARSELTRKDFEDRLALFERQLVAGGQPLSALSAAQSGGAAPAAAVTRTEADDGQRRPAEAQLAQERQRQADAQTAAQQQAQRDAELKRQQEQRTGEAAARRQEEQRRADAESRARQQAEADLQVRERQRRQDEEKARAAEAVRLAAVARQAEEDRARAERELAELKLRLQEQAKAAAEAGGPLSLPANYSHRVALVIGNTRYLDKPLQNPGNDARMMRARLRDIGFTVLYHEDVKVGQIGDIYEQLDATLQAKPGAAFVFYYAGHGTQIDGENFLPAVDAAMTSKFHMPSQSLDPARVIKISEAAKSAVRLIILDACRDNPWQAAGRGLAKGLSKFDPAEGTLILHSTRPGSVAIDQSRGAHGLFTFHLLRHFDMPRLPVERMFKLVAADVRADSGGRQVPWIEGQLIGDFAFRDR